MYRLKHYKYRFFNILAYLLKKVYAFDFTIQERKKESPLKAMTLGNIIGLGIPLLYMFEALVTSIDTHLF